MAAVIGQKSKWQNHIHNKKHIYIWRDIAPLIIDQLSYFSF